MPGRYSCCGRPTQVQRAIIADSAATRRARRVIKNSLEFTLVQPSHRKKNRRTTAEYQPECDGTPSAAGAATQYISDIASGEWFARPATPEVKNAVGGNSTVEPDSPELGPSETTRFSCDFQRAHRGFFPLSTAAVAARAQAENRCGGSRRRSRVVCLLRLSTQSPYSQPMRHDRLARCDPRVRALMKPLRHSANCGTR
jgi:hypothetical protein